MSQSEYLGEQITQSVIMLHQTLSAQKDVVRRFQNLRSFFIQHGFSTSIPDALIAEWEENARQTQRYIEYGVLEWFDNLRENCLQKKLPTDDVDFAIAEWRKQIQSTYQHRQYPTL